MNARLDNDAVFEAARTHLLDYANVRPHLVNTVAGGVNDLCHVAHLLARRRGWWDEFSAMPEQYRKHFIGAKMALIHSEVSEAVEGHRKGKNDDHLPHRKAIEVELADAMIRIADLAGLLDLDLGGAIIEKLSYNQLRADHTREHRAADGGKGY